MFEANVAPVKVPAAAVTVTLSDPLNDVPLIVLAVANVVAVDALPCNEPVAYVLALLIRP